LNLQRAGLKLREIVVSRALRTQQAGGWFVSLLRGKRGDEVRSRDRSIGTASDIVPPITPATISL
jgi:hypothetical protein